MTSFTLKIIALISMFCDHFGDAFVKHFSFLNLIGRIAFPIFAFQISEGFLHTKNIKKYFFRLGIFALISQIPFSLFSTKFLNASPFSLNVFFTLFIGLLGIYLFDYITKMYKSKIAGANINSSSTNITNINEVSSDTKKIKSRQFLINFIGLIIVILLAYIAEILNTDYGFWGVIVVFMFYILKGKKLATALTFFALCIIHYLPELILSNFHIAYILLALCTFLSIIFINEYNGKQGIKVKYLLYIFYPLHLLLLYFIF